MTELPLDICAGIGPLQFGVVLVFLCLTFEQIEILSCNNGFCQFLEDAMFVVSSVVSHTSVNTNNIYFLECIYSIAIYEYSMIKGVPKTNKQTNKTNVYSY